MNHENLILIKKSIKTRAHSMMKFHKTHFSHLITQFSTAVFSSKFTEIEEWVRIFFDETQVHKFEIMKIKNILNDIFRELLFFNIWYALDVNVTLISANILKNINFYWNIKNDILYNDKNNQKIYEMKTHFEFNILEYNSIKIVLINSTQSRHIKKTVSWIWHFRMKHCMLEMINQIKKIEKVKIMIENVFKTVNCNLCCQQNVWNH